MGAPFDTTDWSLVLEARGPDSPRSHDALARLCQIYWSPLYAYLRRRGHDVDEARDFTQAYFTKLLEKDGLRHVRPEAGRFRTFLLTSLNHMLDDERARAHALKRGGGSPLLSLDLDGAERQYALLADQATPDKLYERRWAMNVLTQALARLEKEFGDQGRASQFERLKPYLVDGQPTASYGALAEMLGTTEAAVKMMVHRLRKRFGIALRAEIARTVASANEIDDELRHLLSALRG